MKTLKEAEETVVKGKGRGRKRGAPKQLFTVHSPNRGKPATVTPNEENESEGEETRMTLRPRQAAIALLDSDSSRDPSPSPISHSMTNSSSSAPFDSKWLLDNIRSIVREEVRAIVREEGRGVNEKLNSIINYINRKEGRELSQRNCVEKIAQSIVTNEAQQDNVEKKIDDLSTMVNTAVKHLPATPEEFNYNVFGMSETEVALMDSDLPSFVVFAARLSDKLFPDQLTLPFKKRDPARILWLTQCLIRRRKWSLGSDIGRHMTLIRKRIDTNARNAAARFAQGLAAVNRQPRHTARGVGGQFARAQKRSVAPPINSYPPPNTDQRPIIIDQKHPIRYYHTNQSNQLNIAPSHHPPSLNCLPNTRNTSEPINYLSNQTFNSNPMAHHTQNYPILAKNRFTESSPLNDPFLNDFDDFDGDPMAREETEFNTNDEWEEWEEEIFESKYSDSTYQISRHRE